MIGFASGIYYSKFHKTVLEFAKNNLPERLKYFSFILTVQKRVDILKLSGKLPEHQRFWVNMAALASILSARLKL